MITDQYTLLTRVKIYENGGETGLNSINLKLHWGCFQDEETIFATTQKPVNLIMRLHFHTMAYNRLLVFRYVLCFQRAVCLNLQRGKGFSIKIILINVLYRIRVRMFRAAAEEVTIYPLHYMKRPIMFENTRFCRQKMTRWREAIIAGIRVGLGSSFCCCLIACFLVLYSCSGYLCMLYRKWFISNGF
ncbi:hypothetical protein CHISP_3354 [Chitinispirillum alkaliphilum]|nr:hypothetical protein CHISP_3354 [Chitinispirillum alkaliphilum]